MTIAKSLGRQIIYLSDPDVIHEALVTHAEHLEKTEEMRRLLRPALGEGLLTADRDAAKWQRRALASTFTHDRLIGMIPAFIAAAEETRDAWLALPSGSPIDVSHAMMRTTFHIICDTVFLNARSIDWSIVERGMNDYLGSANIALALAFFRLPEWLPYPGKRRSRLACDAMRGLIRSQLTERRQKGGGTNDLGALLLNARDPETARGLDDEAIIDNLMTFASAGHETTALALAWTLALLVEHPEIGRRVCAEVAAVTGGAPLEAAHIEKLVYCRQVICETMRLYPPAPMLARRVTRDMKLAGMDLPAETILIIPTYALHRHVHLWPEPERFDPDRFAPANAKARHRYAYIPFGAGARICIGSGFALLEAVSVLAVLAGSGLIQRLHHVDGFPSPVMHVTLRAERPVTMALR